MLHALYLTVVTQHHRTECGLGLLLEIGGLGSLANLRNLPEARFLRFVALSVALSGL